MIVELVERTQEKKMMGNLIRLEKDHGRRSLPIPCRGGIRLLPQLREGIGCGGDGEVDGGGGRLGGMVEEVICNRERRCGVGDD